MLVFKRAFSILMLMLFAQVGVAELSDKKALQLIQLSGFDKQIESFPKMVKSGIKEEMESSKNEKTEELKKIVSNLDQLVTQEELVERAQAIFKQSLSKDDYKHLKDWYKSDIGKKFVEADIAATDPKGIKEMQQQAEELFNDKDRVSWANQVEEVTQASEIISTMQQKVGVALAYSMLQATGSEVEMDVADLEKMMLQQTENQKPQLKQKMILSMLYAYREFSMEELNVYLKELNADYMQRFYKTQLGAVEEVMTKLATALGEMAGKTKEVDNVAKGEDNIRKEDNVLVDAKE